MRKRNRLTVTEYHLSSSRLPAAFEGCRLALLADLHNTSLGRDNDLVLQALHEMEPEYLLIAGDWITEEKMGKRRIRKDAAEHLLGRLCGRWPVIYGFGNHEKRWQECEIEGRPGFPEWKEKVRDLGARLLDNQSIRLCKDGAYIRVTGLNLPLRYYVSPKARLRRLLRGEKEPAVSAGIIRKYCGPADKNTFQVLIAHTPAYSAAYEEWGADLTVAGHYHGGLVRLPFLGGAVSPSLELFPAFTKGLYTLGKGSLAVSAGLGSHTIPIRFLNPPELVILHLHQIR